MLLAGGRAKRILLIEDDAGIREGMGDLLALEGYRVDRAANGEEGLARARELRPDVVTLDIRMPKLGGLQTLERLMAEQHVPADLAAEVWRLLAGEQQRLAEPAEISEV